MFENVYKKILNSKKGDEFSILGKKRRALFLARYFMKSCQDGEYLKCFFDDGTILEVMPEAREFYFGDDERRNINKDMKDDVIEIDGKKFIAESGSDYQFVKEIYFGKIEDGEGECIFRDYTNDNEIWSLAIISATQEESDIFVRKIEPEEIR